MLQIGDKRSAFVANAAKSFVRTIEEADAFVKQSNEYVAEFSAIRRRVAELEAEKAAVSVPTSESSVVKDGKES